MLIIGERVNTSRKRMREAVQKKESPFIRQEAKRQADAGAMCIDVNCGTFVGQEAEYMAWLVDTIQEVVDLPLCIDSPDPKALKVGLERHTKGQPMINSITMEKDRFDQIVPLVLEHQTMIVGLCMAEGGMPNTAEERLDIASHLIEGLTSVGVPIGDIYIDPVVCPVGTDTRNGRTVLEAIHRIRTSYEGVHILCGLSNVSFGLPLRKLLNQNFLTMCMVMGLDAVILDPLDPHMMSHLMASDTLLGNDDFCMNYLAAQREGRLGI